MTSYGKPAAELDDWDLFYEAARMMMEAVVPVGRAQEFIEMAEALRARAGKLPPEHQKPGSEAFKTMVDSLFPRPR